MALRQCCGELNYTAEKVNSQGVYLRCRTCGNAKTSNNEAAFVLADAQGVKVSGWKAKKNGGKIEPRLRVAGAAKKKEAQAEKKANALAYINRAKPAPRRRPFSAEEAALKLRQLLAATREPEEKLPDSRELRSYGRAEFNQLIQSGKLVAVDRHLAREIIRHLSHRGTH